MKYFIEKDTNYPFETAVQKITEAMTKEGLGILLPCNVVVQQTGDGKTKVAIVSNARC
jgi:uncharacterized protein (DUF302 family)